MFYCERCRKRNDWPESFSGSRGPCECCGKTADCYDVHSSLLPLSKSRKRKIHSRCVDFDPEWRFIAQHDSKLGKLEITAADVLTACALVAKIKRET